MLKNILKKNIHSKSKKDEEELMPFNLRGELTIIGEKNGEVFHYDKSDNIVTIWAKHATMHLLTGESYTTHGDIPLGGSGDSTVIRSSRSINPNDHTGSVNNDGTLISDRQYFSDNVGYHEGGKFRYFSLPNIEGDDTDNNTDITGDYGTFKYPFFPTKILFGTGVEFSSWSDVINAGFPDDPSNIASYAHDSNGGWNETDFNNMIDNVNNYYSNIWNSSEKRLVKARTVNDIYSGVLGGDPPYETDFAIPGAIKNSFYHNSSSTAGLGATDGKTFARGSYRGVGRPAFVYARRGRFFRDGVETRLSLGETEGTRDLESKITFSVTLPEQSNGEYYPHNGYTLKIAGLYCDARLVLRNTVPTDDQSPNSVSDDTENEYTNYMKMPCGIMWAKRKIAPIYKSHDVNITAQWSIYLP